MSRRLDWLKAACLALGLRLDVPILDLGGGRVVNAAARVRDIGEANGILIVRSYDEVQNLLNELRQAGYGFSVLDEPSSTEDFDLDVFREMFLDWVGPRRNLGSPLGGPDRS